MAKWYEEETPISTSTVGGTIRFFPIAGKIQVSQANWTDAEGVTYHGKTVTLNLDKFIGDESTKAVLTAIVDAL